jgi:hypothetical protein
MPPVFELQDEFERQQARLLELSYPELPQAGLSALALRRMLQPLKAVLDDALATASGDEFMLAGSRRGDRRVLALWIPEKAPKLGWCWEGNSHSWLGVASAERRVAYAG